MFDIFAWNISTIKTAANSIFCNWLSAAALVASYFSSLGDVWRKICYQMVHNVPLLYQGNRRLLAGLHSATIELNLKVKFCPLHFLNFY